jgi:hypothetical protein
MLPGVFVNKGIEGAPQFFDIIADHPDPGSRRCMRNIGLWCPLSEVVELIAPIS